MGVVCLIAFVVLSVRVWVFVCLLLCFFFDVAGYEIYTVCVCVCLTGGEVGSDR